MLPHKYQIYKTKMENVTKQHHIYIKQKWKMLLGMACHGMACNVQDPKSFAENMKEENIFYQ